MKSNPPSPGASTPSSLLKKDLIEDIKPVPSKERSSLGIAELTLDQGQVVKAVGLVYGLEHQLSGPGYDATLFLDLYNQRIKISNYNITDFSAFILKVRWLTEANGFDKIICMARHEDWEEFLKFGYVLEAVLKYYHNGEDAFVVSKFRSQERLTSQNLMDEILMIEKLMAQEQSPSRKALPQGFEVRLARREDIPQLLELYKTIFESYPSPLIHQSYLETIFQKESLFAVCVQGSTIAAAASAELYPLNRAAELTDCATLSNRRGLGLMSHILAYLEERLAEKKYVCAYTMARARSFGMNSVFYHLGYEFLGRLVNNCDIYGAYEDMNIWVRKISGDLTAPVTSVMSEPVQEPESVT